MRITIELFKNKLPFRNARNVKHISPAYTLFNSFDSFPLFNFSRARNNIFFNVDAFSTRSGSCAKIMPSCILSFFVTQCWLSPLSIWRAFHLSPKFFRSKTESYFLKDIFNVRSVWCFLQCPWNLSKTEI